MTLVILQIYFLCTYRIYAEDKDLFQSYLLFPNTMTLEFFVSRVQMNQHEENLTLGSSFPLREGGKHITGQSLKNKSKHNKPANKRENKYVVLTKMGKD